MPTGLGASLGLGGGRAATSSGAPAGGGTPWSNAWSCGFDGTADYLGCGDIDDMSDIGALTFSVWIYPTEDGNMVAGGDNALSSFFFQTSGTNLYFGVGHTSWVTLANAGVTNAVTLDEWNHVCCVWDKTISSPYGAVYVNGVAQTITAGVLPTVNNLAGAFDGFTIGKYSAGAFWDGKIDEVALWPTALTAGNAATIANAAASSGSKAINLADQSFDAPAHWWRMGDTGSDAAGGDGAAVSLITDAGDTGGSNATQGTGSAQPALSTSVP